MVEYREVRGFPGYRVGDDGTVWSCLQRSSTGSGQLCYVVGPTWRRLKSWPTGPKRRVRRYHVVKLSDRRTRYVHRLVLEAFAGPCPPGMEACHRDGNPHNNAARNLRWDTPQGNAADKRRHGTHAVGEAVNGAKMSADRVRAIREEYAAGGVTHSDLARRHGVSRPAIAKIVRHARWAHV